MASYSQRLPLSLNENDSHNPQIYQLMGRATPLNYKSSIGFTLTLVKHIKNILKRETTRYRRSKKTSQTF